jgi:hypothetical protein
MLERGCLFLAVLDSFELGPVGPAADVVTDMDILRLKPDAKWLWLLFPQQLKVKRAVVAAVSRLLFEKGFLLLRILLDVDVDVMKQRGLSLDGIAMILLVDRLAIVDVMDIDQERFSQSPRFAI